MQPLATPHRTAAAGGARLAAAATLTWARASSCAGTLSPCTWARIWTMVAACASQLALRAAACMRCQASSSGCPGEASKRQCAMFWLYFKNDGPPRARSACVGKGWGLLHAAVLQVKVTER
jgi:hypothetical protein